VNCRDFSDKPAQVISTYDITQHWVHWHDEKQVYYVRILGMVVIYAVESWSALRFRVSLTLTGLLLPPSSALVYAALSHIFRNTA